MSLLQKGHVTTAAQQTQRAIDGNLCVLGVSAVRFCSGVSNYSGIARAGGLRLA
jgi:hypothetical protein